MEGLAHDVRQAARSLSRHPVLTLLIGLTLAVAIGPNTAAYSILYGVVLRPLPFPNPQQLVVLEESDPRRGVAEEPVDDGAFPIYERSSHAFSEMGAAWPWERALRGPGGLRPLYGAWVSSGLFEALGVRPLLGRTFLPGEARRNGPHVLILSYRFWADHFGGDPHVVGKALVVSQTGGRKGQKEYTVVGVMPRGFRFPYPYLWRHPVEVWNPLPAWYSRPVDAHNTRVVARLKIGTSLRQAQADVALVARHLARQYPRLRTGVTARVAPLAARSASRARLPLLLLFAATGLILLIACVNVSALLLARSEIRRREVAIRAVVGASRPRLLRQMLAEAVLLGSLAAAAGTVLFAWVLPIITRWAPHGFFIPRLDGVRVSLRAIAYALLTAWGAAVLSSLVPALGLTRTSLSEAIKGSPPPAGSSRFWGRRRMGILVSAEVAMAVALLATSGLMLKSLSNLERVDLGFNPRKVLAARLSLPSTWTSRPRVVSFAEQFLQRARGLPGVKRVALVDTFPLRALNDFRYNLATVGAGLGGGRPIGTCEYHVVTPSYFRVAGDRLLQGRLLTDSDGPGSPRVADVNEALARRHWPGEDPVGKQIVLSPSQFQPPPRLTIIGVVKDHLRFGLHNQPQPSVYASFFQDPHWVFRALLTTRLGAGGLAGSVRRLVGTLSANVLVDEVATGEELFARSISRADFVGDMLVLFALMAVFLAVLGTYGVVSHVTARREHEIGIRVAVGARRGDVMRLLLGQGMLWVAVGLSGGLALALGVARLLHSLLYRVAPSSPSIYAAASLLILAASLLACYVPARRAANADPIHFLRHE